jgi:phage terminase Nu1 subunit (DNA packaging protein)
MNIGAHMIKNTDTDLWSVQRLVSSSPILANSGQQLKLNRWKTISPPLTCDRADQIAATKMRRGLSCFRAINGVAEALPVGAVIEEVQP